VRRADNLTTFKCRLSRNLGASTSWNPQGLSRRVMGLLYLLYVQTFYPLWVMCFLYDAILEPALLKVSMWTVFLKTSVINHTDVQRSSQWVSADDGDIRRRNICREVIVVNKKCVSWWLCSYIENARWKQQKVFIHISTLREEAY
jgi:hypothetical protein